MDEKHLGVALRYVERNPVRANLVQRPEDYEGSSAPAHIGAQRNPGLLDWAFYDEFGGRERWAVLLAEPEESVEIPLLQRGTFTGRPVGDTAFVGRMEEQLGRSLALKRKPRRLVGLEAKAK